MNLLKIFISVLAAAVFCASCNNVDFRKTSAGIPYKVYASSKGDSVRVNYFVKYHVIQKIKDSTLINSYLEIPIYEQVQQLNRKITYTDIRGNVMEILPKLKTGDSLYIVQSTDSMMKENPSQVEFKKGGELVTTIRILNVYKTVEEATAAQMKDNEPKMKEAIQKASQAEQENLVKFKSDTAIQKQVMKDNQLIESYLKAKNIQATKTDWGVYVQVINPGQGPKPGIGKYTSIKYSGAHFSGVEFDSGVFPLQIGTPGSIKGFENGIMQLSKGGKAKIFIPSTLGYGPGGREPEIKPNENLIFDLELLDISDSPIRQQPQPPTQPQMNMDSSRRQK